MSRTLIVTLMEATDALDGEDLLVYERQPAADTIPTTFLLVTSRGSGSESPTGRDRTYIIIVR